MRKLEGIRVVTATEMTRVEALAIAAGHRADLFMQQAGEAVAEYVDKFITQNECAKEVGLLVGKGNNGGDAYTAGVALVRKGIPVSAYHLFPLNTCTLLCREQCEAFQKAGGIVHFLNHKNNELALPKQGVIVDGLVGTGFTGQAEGILAEVIQAANTSGLPIIAIDIPSGVNGTTGEVGSVAINAVLTIYLELPKRGFFLHQGYDHIGELAKANFGLPQEYYEMIHADAYLYSQEALHDLVPAVHRTQNKYSRGYVLGVAGSPGMTGAAFMSCLAAMRAGAGIVRLFHPETIQEELSAAPWELIREPFSFAHPEAIFKEAERAGSLFFGPGIGRQAAISKLLAKLLHELQIPMVIDADGIDALSKISVKKFRENCVITPHRGELKKLLAVKEIEEEELLALTQKYADLHSVTIVYKGAPTWIFHPKTLPLIMPVGDPGMATAGSGDVLTGVIAAFLAQELPAREAAAMGVALHGAAGKIAAAEYTSHAMVATDIIAALPQAYQAL